jgi:low affinity Fe/Cu permease
MVFLIQNSQNRGDAALHAKLDEIIRVLPTRNELIGLQLKSEEEIASAGEEIQVKAEENTNPS